MRLYNKNDKSREIDSDRSKNKSRSEFRRDYARLIHSAAFRRLQGKTQLFPGNESDFFRNRLTHSLEVAQIAKGIALKINGENDFFNNQEIDVDIVETAGLVHDLGHPPFGHNGEMALDDCMKQFGGFEGNAQTLRILACLEKKEMYEECPNGITQSGKDKRAGLNLTYRMLAAAVKYDNKIPLRRTKDVGLVKGYYSSEAGLVQNIKDNILGEFGHKRKLKTIECHIMDVADDIAYSTYDLEDSLKAGFLTPLGMFAADAKLFFCIAEKVSKSIGAKFTADDVVDTLLDIFSGIFSLPKDLSAKTLSCGDKNDLALLVTQISKISQQLGTSGYLRTRFTSDLVNEFIGGIEVDLDTECPPLSSVYLREDIFRKVEVLKHYTYEATIMSPRLKVVQHRGYEIVSTIFKALDGKSDSMEGYLLLPDDFRVVYEAVKTKAEKKRAICDFVSGMTDRYAVEFYSRLKSENAQTIFKPL